jgi:phosphatidylglycerophosphate synthase
MDCFNTALQVAAVFLVLVSGTFANVELIGLVADTALYLVAGLTVASGLDYIYRYSRKQKDEA